MHFFRLPTLSKCPVNTVRKVLPFQREDTSAPPATKLDDGIFTSSEEGLAPSDNTSESTNNNDDDITKTLEKLESISRNDNSEE